MPSVNIPLPTLTMSSGATASPATWDVRDAEAVAIITTVSTAPGLRIQAELTDTGNNWFNLVQTSSSTVTIQDVRGVARLRMATSAASTGGLSALGGKHTIV